MPKAMAFVQGHNLELYHGYASLRRGIQNMRSSCRFYRVRDVPTVTRRTPTLHVQNVHDVCLSYESRSSDELRLVTLCIAYAPMTIACRVRLALPILLRLGTCVYKAVPALELIGGYRPIWEL